MAGIADLVRHRQAIGWGPNDARCALIWAIGVYCRQLPPRKCAARKRQLFNDSLAKMRSPSPILRTSKPDC